MTYFWRGHSVWCEQRGSEWRVSCLCYQLKGLNRSGCSSHLLVPRPPHLTCWGWNQKQDPGSGFSCAAGHGLKPGQTGLRKEAFQLQQILPLIRNGHGRKNLSQSATGLDIANNFSSFWRSCARISSNCTWQVRFCLCIWKTGSSNTEKKRDQGQEGSLNEIRHK